MSSPYGSIAVQGLFNSEMSFTSTITTTSSSDVLITGMTITPPAGTYFAIFGTWLTNTTGNQPATISIYVGGVQKASSIVTIVPFSGAVGSVNDGLAVSTHGIVVVNGSQAITIEWHTGGGTVSAHNGTFDVIKIG